LPTPLPTQVTVGPRFNVEPLLAAIEAFRSPPR
jgi:hypothetical protein